MKRRILTVCLLCLVAGYGLGQQGQYSFSTLNWEGGWWSGNNYQGPWFPSSDTLAIFSIDDYSWGQTRTLDTLSINDSVQIRAQILANSGGVNGDYAFFSLGNQWVEYGGGNSYGILFSNGNVVFRENGNNGPTIGTYQVGEMITFTMKLGSNDTLKVRGARFSGDYSPQNRILGKKLIFASANSESHRGFAVKAVTYIHNNVSSNYFISPARWEGQWWSGNINMGSWFPSFDRPSYNFGIDNYSWGIVRTIPGVAIGDSIQVSAQILLNAGGTNGNQAYFVLGDQWVSYGSGRSYFGLKFYNGRIYYDSTGANAPDSIGTYAVGEPLNFSLKRLSDSLQMRGTTFFKTKRIPSLPNGKWTIASANCEPYRGVLLTQASVGATSVPGLVAYYPFTGNANDASGNGNHGTVFGATMTTDRFNHPNSAYSFNGISDSIRVLNSSSLNPPYFTLCGWVYYLGGAYNAHPLNKGLQFDFFIERSVGGYLRSHINNLRFDSDSIVQDSVWTFICLVKDTNTVRIYKAVYPSNSVSLVASLPYAGIVVPTSSNFTIGSRAGVASTSFQGKIDDVRLFGRALAQNEIQTITSVSTKDRSIPTTISLSQNYPNPFNPSTTIRFEMPQRGDVQVNIYNSLGQLVRSLVNEKREPGSHSVVWDGRGNAGTVVSSGVYFYQVKAGEFVQAKKMLLLK
jgi:hypothetical protein